MGDLWYLAKERALPGFYWGVGLVGVATTIILVVAAAAAVPLLFLAGAALGLFVAYWWCQIRSYTELAEWREDLVWWYGVASFGGLAGVAFLFLLDGVVLTLAPEALAPLVLYANAVPAGWTLGSLTYVAVRWLRSWWEERQEGQPRPSQGGRPSRAFIISPRLYERLYGWRGRMALAAVVVIALIMGGGFWLLSGGPTGGRRPTPTLTATAQPKATATARPSPTRPLPTTVIPTPPPTATATLVLVMPPPPGPTPATATETKRAPTPTRTRVPASPTPTCFSYTTKAGDGWTEVQKGLNGAPLAEIMRRNPGRQPTAAGVKFFHPNAPAACK